MSGPISEEILRLKNENIRVRWLIGQLMQRFNKEFIIFRMDNPQAMTLKIEEDFGKREVRITAKPVSKDEGSGPRSDDPSGGNPIGQTGLN